MEIFLCGRDSVEACVKMRPAALREIFVDEKKSKLFTELQSGIGRERIEWKAVSSTELSRIAGTPKHGGIVARTERPEPAQVKPAMRDDWHAAGEKVLFLENISDAAQLASIARVGAICGVTRVIADEKVSVPALANSRVWSASGGALEMLKIYRTESMAGMLRMMSEKYFVVGLVREGGRRIDYSAAPAFPGKPVSLFLSGDENGVPAEMISRCGYLFHVPEPESAILHYSPAELAALVLPWISSRVKRPGAGFLARKKARAQ